MTPRWRDIPQIDGQTVACLEGSTRGTYQWSPRDPMPIGWRRVEYDPAYDCYMIAPRWYALPLRTLVVLRNHGYWLRALPQLVREWWSYRPGQR